eukprot:m.223414 g.223414  ORF g.223414 m.223414 type:complete len:109 (+) comp33402_c0_seq8:38-364(+)
MSYTWESISRWKGCGAVDDRTWDAADLVATTLLNIEIRLRLDVQICVCASAVIHILYMYVCKYKVQLVRDIEGGVDNNCVVTLRIHSCAIISTVFVSRFNFCFDSGYV